MSIKLIRAFVLALSVLAGCARADLADPNYCVGASDVKRPGQCWLGEPSRLLTKVALGPGGGCFDVGSDHFLLDSGGPAADPRGEGADFLVKFANDGSSYEPLVASRVVCGAKATFRMIKCAPNQPMNDLIKHGVDPETGRITTQLVEVVPAPQSPDPWATRRDVKAAIAVCVAK